jgi:hypothetical protein
MSKTRNKPAIAAPVGLYDVPRALNDLALDVPYYTVRVVGDRLEFRCYGGQVLIWPVPTAAVEAHPPTGGEL